MINPVIAGSGRKLLKEIKNTNSRIDNMSKVLCYSGEFTFNNGFCTVKYADVGLSSKPKTILISNRYGNETEVKQNFYTIQYYGPEIFYIYARNIVSTTDGQCLYQILDNKTISLDLVLIY